MGSNLIIYDRTLAATRPCPVCKASPGEPCVGRRKPRVSFHQERFPRRDDRWALSDAYSQAAIDEYTRVPPGGGTWSPQEGLRTSEGDAPTMSPSSPP